MPSFAFIKDGVVRFIESVSPAGPSTEKWIALFRSGVLLKETTRYDVMPGDLFLDGKFYKKDIEDGTTTLLEEGVFTHPNSIRFAGIMDGEIVGQYGKRKDTFENQEKIDEYVNIIISSEIVELTSEQLSFVEVGWLYDGSNFTNPD
jgi:hypothetical protein